MNWLARAGAEPASQAAASSIQHPASPQPFQIGRITISNSNTKNGANNNGHS